MILKEEFIDKKQQAAENKAFSPIKAYGLMTFAEEAYGRFAEDLDITPSRETRNAYMLQFAFVLDEFGAFNPDAIEDVIQSERMRATRLIRQHGNEYLDETSAIVGVSNELYAAAIAASVIKAEPDLDMHKALIGEDALAMITTTDLFYEEHGRLFQKPYTSAETKLLHLARTGEQLEQVAGFTKIQMEEAGAISIDTASYGKSLSQHVGALGLRPNRSELEAHIASTARGINESLNNTPVAGSNVIFSFPHQDPPDDPDVPPPPSNDDDGPANG